MKNPLEWKMSPPGIEPPTCRHVRGMCPCVRVSVVRLQATPFFPTFHVTQNPKKNANTSLNLSVCMFWHVVALKRAVGIRLVVGERLTAEAVQGASLSLQSVDHVHGGDRLSLCVFAVRDSIANDVFKEQLQHTANLFVDEARDSLDTASSRQSPDGWFSNALDVVPKHLSVTLGATLAESFAALATSRHDVLALDQRMRIRGAAHSYRKMHALYYIARAQSDWLPAQPIRFELFCYGDTAVLVWGVAA